MSSSNRHICHTSTWTPISVKIITQIRFGILMHAKSLKFVWNNIFTPLIYDCTSRPLLGILLLVIALRQLKVYRCHYVYYNLPHFIPVMCRNYIPVCWVNRNVLAVTSNGPPTFRGTLPGYQLYEPMLRACLCLCGTTTLTWQRI